MKATYDNSFCMDSKCIHYFEDSCMVCLEEKGTEVAPYNLEYIEKHGRGKSTDCPEFRAGSHLMYVVDGEDIAESLKGEDWMEIKVKYFNKDYPRLEKIVQGDWIDLRVDTVKKKHDIQTNTQSNLLLANDEFKKGMTYKKGDVIKFGLGVAIELPEGYEAEIRPRSSTFSRYGLMQTNSVGTIDNSYCGDNDEWQIEFIAMRNGFINRFDRVCQFRIWENQPEFNLVEVEHLGNENRGGYGTTGR